MQTALVISLFAGGPLAGNELETCWLLDLTAESRVTLHSRARGTGRKRVGMEWTVQGVGLKLNSAPRSPGELVKIQVPRHSQFRLSGVGLGWSLHVKGMSDSEAGGTEAAPTATLKDPESGT